ncbi:MAG: DUF4194 domain-containing protein [Actinobacteria bacterium]|nr:DUF4194 domain-containing protein [Actinomycetota bacterium]MCL5445574.1 DUF4194 domain-containing protein [Actinomycetota bacterium]
MNEAALDVANGPTEFSLVVIHLMNGPLYRDSHEKLWDALLRERHDVADYVAKIGLNVVVDEAEGYCYLRSQPPADDAPEFPRLVARRTLSFHVSVLLALLRRRLAEFDASSAEVRLVLNREQIVELLRVFMPASTNDARLVDRVDTHINKVVELGFLRRLAGSEELFEVRRIIKAYVDAQWLSEFDKRLDEYLVELGGESDSTDGDEGPTNAGELT